ncbi:MAG: CRISPR-associated endonuclease Cas2 [Clostridia bacterium]|nr:CRISPR-associated endonuclease Cas2 [Clostridia bacterium]
MRIFVFFDLPTETPEDRRQYRRFRKTLIRHGFLMMQESVYCKLLTSPAAEQAARHAVRRHKPAKGLVQLLTVTEKQFANMEFLVGAWQNDVVDTTERVIVL